MGKRPPTQVGDIILQSAELKKLIIERIRELNIGHKEVIENAKCLYAKHYLNEDHIYYPRDGFKQKDIINLAEYLGIDIRITLVLKDITQCHAYQAKQRTSSRSSLTLLKNL